MIKRSITIFPEFENGRLIEGLRAKYDPLYQQLFSQRLWLFWK
ncbi:MAG: hypothetical protein ACQEUT_14415 [Bacillota bacterium]